MYSLGIESQSIESGEGEGSISEYKRLIQEQLFYSMNSDTHKSTRGFSGLPDYQSDPAFEIPTGAFRYRSWGHDPRQLAISQHARTRQCSERRKRSQAFSQPVGALHQ